MAGERDLLDEIFSLLHQQMQTRQDGIADGQAEDYEKRAERIDQLIDRLTGQKGPILSD
jgi:ATP-dependent protease ClpP protease subunit